MDPRHHLAEESGSWFSLIQTLFYFLTVLNFVVISHFRHSIVKLRFWLEIFIFSIKIKILFLKDQDFFSFFSMLSKGSFTFVKFFGKNIISSILWFCPPLLAPSYLCHFGLHQGMLKGEVSMYHWPPVGLVWISLFCK